MKNLALKTVLLVSLSFVSANVLASDDLIGKFSKWGQIAAEATGVAIQKGSNLVHIVKVCQLTADDAASFPKNTAYCEALRNGLYRQMIETLENNPQGSAVLTEWKDMFSVTANEFIAARVEAELVSKMDTAANANELGGLDDLSRRTAYFILSVKGGKHSVANKVLELFPEGGKPV